MVMCLIDVALPTSSQQKQDFHNMVVKNNMVNMVLNISVQMSASVDDTQNMVLINCI